MPASQRRGEGGAALLVLASEQPADRLDAERVHALLQQLAAFPAEAAEKYCTCSSLFTFPACHCSTYTAAVYHTDNTPLNGTGLCLSCPASHPQVRSLTIATCRAAAWRLHVLERCCRPAMAAMQRGQPPPRGNTLAGGAPAGAQTAGATWDTALAAGVLAGLTAAMADLIRQVDTECAERGVALALTWNIACAVSDALIGVCPPRALSVHAAFPASVLHSSSDT